MTNKRRPNQKVSHGGLLQTQHRKNWVDFYPENQECSFHRKQGGGYFFAEYIVDPS